MNSICVLIPTKNRKQLLERALASVFNQTVTPNEIIVVNDGSIDDTELFLKKITNSHSNLKVINRKSSGGVNVARHDGIDQSDSEWVACLDDDDEFFSDAIEKIKCRLDKIPDNYNIVFFNSIINKSNGSFSGGYQFDDSREFVDLNYDDMMLIKSKVRGDFKPVMRKKLFSHDGYRFPESVNGLESHFFYLVARDGKGLRCYRDICTNIHQENEIYDRLSINASKKNPWPLLKLHVKQIPQHYKFYLRHPLLLVRKLEVMLRLLIRSTLPFLFR